MKTDETTCVYAREWLSAFRDAEVADDPTAEAHLEACGACSAWTADFDQLTRVLRLRAPQAPPSINALVNNLPFDPSASPTMRAGQVLLVVAAATGFLSVVVGLAGIAGHAHLGSTDGRQAEAMTLALIGGYALAAWRPVRMAYGLLPVAMLAAVITVTLSAMQLTAGSARLLDEIWHLPLLLGAGGVALAAKAAPTLSLTPRFPAAGPVAPTR